MRGKMVWAGQWVKVRNMMNKRFAAAGPCNICRRLSCAPVWYSIHTKEIRCTKCYDAMAEHSKYLEEDTS